MWDMEKAHVKIRAFFVCSENLGYSWELLEGDWELSLPRVQ